MATNEEIGEFIQQTMHVVLDMAERVLDDIEQIAEPNGRAAQLLAHSTSRARLMTIAAVAVATASTQGVLEPDNVAKAAVARELVHMGRTDKWLEAAGGN